MSIKGFAQIFSRINTSSNSSVSNLEKRANSRPSLFRRKLDKNDSL